jgi:hypothetical protein
MRIVALSDQHGFLPDVPPCDLLTVAGDVCPDRFGPFMAVHDPYQQQAWFDRTVRPWLAATPATHKLLTWGNHDWCGQMCSFRSDTPAHARSTDLQILVDEGTSVSSAGGAGREMSVWATPWSDPFMRWAFMKRPSDLERVYAAIPDGIDVLVSHQPPYGYGDSTLDVDSRHLEHVGSRELLVAIERVRPEGRDLWACSRRLRPLRASGHSDLQRQRRRRELPARQHADGHRPAGRLKNVTVKCSGFCAVH